MTLEVMPETGFDDSSDWRRLVANKINRLILGGGDASNTVTLSPGTTQTTIVDVRIGVTSKIILVPEDTLAAAQLSASYVSNIQSGKATINHAASGGTMGYVIANS